MGRGQEILDDDDDDKSDDKVPEGKLLLLFLHGSSRAAPRAFPAAVGSIPPLAGRALIPRQEPLDGRAQPAARGLAQDPLQLPLVEPHAAAGLTAVEDRKST